MTIRHLRGGVALIGTATELATANPVLLERQLSLETDTGVQKIGDGTTHYASLTALPGGGDGSSGLPTAVPTAVSSLTLPNPKGADPGPANMQGVVVSDGAPVLAFALEGDVFPRFVLYADAGDGITMGDGQIDPYNDGSTRSANICLVNDSRGLMLWGADGLTLDASNGPIVVTRQDLKLTAPGKGVVLCAPDSSYHRLIVANDGTLSTEPVA